MENFIHLFTSTEMTIKVVYCMLMCTIRQRVIFFPRGKIYKNWGGYLELCLTVKN